MKQTAVEWLVEQIFNDVDLKDSILKLAINQTKEMEKKEKLKHQLFIGKVTDIIGFDKTLELLRECNNTIK